MVFEQRRERPSYGRIRSTFARRGTELKVAPACFGDSFAATPTKATQWKGFLKTAQVSDAPTELPDVSGHVREFLVPVVETIAAGQEGERQWKIVRAWGM
ncbi:MAG: hypothetical protein WD534_05275 [Phycisphaeraceae bacterium]